MFGLIAGLGASFLGNHLSRRASERTARENEAMSWRMWNAANSYNDPSAVMERYKRAGLNPNLIYGHMPMSPQPAITRADTPSTKFDVDWMLDGALENQQLQNASVRAEIENRGLNSANIRANTASTILQSSALAQKMLNDQRQADDVHIGAQLQNKILALNYAKDAAIADFFGLDKDSPSAPRKSRKNNDLAGTMQFGTVPMIMPGHDGSTNGYAWARGMAHVAKRALSAGLGWLTRRR